MVTQEAARTARLAALAFAVLLLLTFGAFFLAARLKAQPAVLNQLHRLRYFSPNGDGRRDADPIEFSAKLDDQAAVDIVDADGARVRRLADRLRIRSGRLLRVTWDGRQDDGTIAPDGRYRLRLILRGQGRAVLSGKALFLDTIAPDPAVLVSASEPDDRLVSPGEPVQFALRGASTNSRPRFRVLRTDVRPVRTVRRWRGARGDKDGTWDGRDDAGTPVAPGTYLIAVTSRDRAGNDGTSPPLPPQPGAIPGRPGVTVRTLAVQPPVRPVAAGELTSFRVDARGSAYRWSIRRLATSRPVVAGRRPQRGTTLLVRIPADVPAGVHVLEVSAAGHTTRVPFAVSRSRPPRRSRPLVVLPVITWLGRDPLDDGAIRDGVPDTFLTGATVPYPRLFAYAGGSPTNFAVDVSPLLVWLDRHDVRYDLTTDLALDLDGAPHAGDPQGILFAGAPEWVSRPLARRLRAFVAAGGRVAVFGTGALRGGVTVGDERLSRATPPGPVDAFGARLAPVRTLRPLGGRPPRLSVLRDDPAVGLLEGFGGVLGGFTRVEELASPGRRATVLAGVGRALTQAELDDAERRNRTPPPERPALSAVRDGRGLVIRVGLPGWAQRLRAGDAAVEQLTFNVLDLLRGVRPKPRSAR